MLLPMDLEAHHVWEQHLTIITSVFKRRCLMSLFMLLEVPFLAKSLITELAVIRLLACMDAYMINEIPFLGEPFRAIIKRASIERFEWFLRSELSFFNQFLFILGSFEVFSSFVRTECIFIRILGWLDSEIRSRWIDLRCYELLISKIAPAINRKI